MSRFKRLVIPGVFALILAIAPAAPGQAYETWNDRHLVFGVSNQEFWLDNSADGWATDSIVDGVHKWNNAVGMVSYSRTSTKADSRLDWYHVNVNDNACAVTRMFVDTTNVQNNNGVPQQNWWWARVNIRDAFKDTDACGPVSHRDAITAHEMGHAMGLAHATGNVLMNAYIAWPAYYDVNGPKADDVNGIQHLY